LFLVRALPTLALGFAVGLSACSDAGPGNGTGEGGVDEAEALRLGRVHLVLSSLPSPPETELEADSADGFELTARFAMVRGLDEEFVRARADMPDLLEDLLNPGQCAAESSLWATDLAPENAEPGHELLLVDAGEFEVRVGDTRLEVPLSLVPDLLPYMSGVEYAYFSENGPMLDDAEAVTVLAAGGLTDDLPAFTVESPLPAAIDLNYTAEDLASVDAPGGGALVVRWAEDAASSSGTIGLRFTPLLGDEPVGDDILCVVEDRGQTRLELSQLRTLGLAADADMVRVEASRVRASLFDVGAWAGTELVVERRDVATLPLR